MAGTWEANVLFFLLLGRCVARDCRERDVQKERGASIRPDPGHCWGGGGHSWPSCWLWQMQAPDEVRLSKSLLQHHPAMDSGGVQLPPAGQKFSGTEAGALGCVRLHAVFLHGSKDGREHFCLLGWVGWFFFFFLCF